ncbi:MAG: methylated-DNA--[protein]-cysteine S-methyltransferase, partial [Gemmatimonadetes bacterium]|nr:methylated-DNA--[protein]-cysteine S-methyltransferase [Gemmatimonadota bacterium]NIQ56056.1 methylated-DNA--[protein]-cysteine S-methyltransferase [Gemmatimonadota bacterium]NIU76250.1 methylated-DNA--[protein]-cysteine S-methyltransferase [Gammaproteobacteria bacterium]NIX45768.1 methylated-DNA--[protein]-cysteine S-methyltransferase [Gemmatimonadota bacterium]NIY10078.1 methylated-DNA--[protein]-cysteine S-methyltransferase [Gemmatimonadota bacterium]
MATAIAYIEENTAMQPSLDDVAGAVGLSPHHFHRLFRRWAGTTPKRFLQLLTIEEAKRRLDESRSVLHAAFETGLSGPGRLHDLFIAVDGVTPGEYATGGRGVDLAHGLAQTPFGTALVGRTERGVCHLSFVDRSAEGAAIALAALAADWPEARLHRDDGAAQDVAERLFSGDRPPLHVQGTNFQIRVWQALLSIPEGRVASYGDVAAGIGRPEAARAVAGAVARNRVAWMIPCHR